MFNDEFNHPRWLNRHHHWDHLNTNRPLSTIPAHTDDNLDLILTDGRPPWNTFDTCLRRVLMLGAATLIWAILLWGIIYAIGAVVILVRYGT